MAKSSSSKVAVGPAHHGPGGADAPSGSVGNFNLGSVGAVSRRRNARRVVPLALHRDTIAASEAARRWLDGPGGLWGEELPLEPSLVTSMEALGVTTRLLAVMHWLLDPANDDEVTMQISIDYPEPEPLPADNPLVATDCDPIALASRQILVRAHQLAIAHGDTP